MGPAGEQRKSHGDRSQALELDSGAGADHTWCGAASEQGKSRGDRSEALELSSGATEVHTKCGLAPEQGKSRRDRSLASEFNSRAKQNHTGCGLGHEQRKPKGRSESAQPGTRAKVRSLQSGLEETQSGVDSAKKGHRRHEQGGQTERFQFFGDGTHLTESDTLFQWWLENESEIETVSVKNSLPRHAAFWEKLTSDPEILQTVRTGYIPPFESYPSPFYKKNNITAQNHPEFVFTSVMELLHNGFAKLSRNPPKVVNPFTVSVQSNGKKRLIADLRHLNENIDTQKFKLEDLNMALPALRQANYIFSFDFKKAYFHINLDPEVQKYFGFSFTYKGQVYYGYYTVAPFGLNTLPQVFTKLLKPLVKRWRDAGLHIFLFLDDGLGACEEEEEAEYFSHMVRSDLGDSGILEQTSKCNWKPCKVLIWLGIMIDLVRRMLVIPEAKREKTCSYLQFLSSRKKVTPRQVLKIAGLINSMAVVLGSKAYIHTKPLFHEVNKWVDGREGWDDEIRLSDKAKACLIGWSKELQKASFEVELDKKSRASILFSDASATGGAAFLHTEQVETSQVEAGLEILEEHGPKDWSREAADMFLMNWTQQEQAHSSTWREARTIQAGLEAFRDRLRNSEVLWYSDNAACASLARKGSMKEVLNPIAARISQICEENQINLKVKWLRRTKNSVADTLSRFIDLDDWGITEELLEMVQARWQQCDIDRFATDKNRKLNQYNSKFSCPGTTAVDAFSQDWAGRTNLLVPPPHLIPQALEHLEKCRAKGILICPFWPSNRFWPFLFSWKGTRYPLRDWVEIRQGARYLVPGEQPNAIFTPSRFKGSLLAAWVDATGSRGR